MKENEQTNINNSLKSVCSYYMKITHKRECFDFYVKYIQPIKDHLDLIENETS